MNENYATVTDRVISTSIDTIVLIAAMWLFSDFLNGIENVPDFVRILLLVMLALYEPICTSYGATLGNHKMQIRVRDVNDTTKSINLFKAIVRYFFKVILGWISFITIFANPKSRTIHDIICGSVMVKSE